MCGYGHNSTSCGEGDPVCGMTTLVAIPVMDEGGLVHVSVDPVAVLEVIANEAVNDLDTRKHVEEVSVIFHVATGGEVFCSLLALLSTVGVFIRTPRWFALTCMREVS